VSGEASAVAGPSGVAVGDGVTLAAAVGCGLTGDMAGAVADVALAPLAMSFAPGGFLTDSGAP
jgi:hypothetical protein